MNAERFRVALAEGLLRIVTSDAHAAAIAGDLAEEAQRGRRGFASDLCSTFAGVAVLTLAGRPVRHAGLLVLAAGVWGVCYVAVRLVLAWSGWLALSVAPGECLAAGGMRAVLLAAALLLAGLLTGLTLVRIERRAAASGALSLSAVFMLSAAALAVGELLSGTASWHCLLTYLVFAPLCYALPLLLGALLGRAGGLSRPVEPA